MTNQGFIAGYLQLPREAAPLPIELRLPATGRASRNDFLRLRVKARPGIVQESTDKGLDQAAQPLVALGELGRFESQWVDRAVHRKDLRPVVYVTADLSGRTPAEVIADVGADLDAAPPEQQETRPGRSAVTCRPVVAMPGPCHRAYVCPGPAKESGASPGWCSAIWGWLLLLRSSPSFSCCASRRVPPAWR
jgi:hypothetical protein